MSCLPETRLALLTSHRFPICATEDGRPDFGGGGLSYPLQFFTQDPHDTYVVGVKAAKHRERHAKEEIMRVDKCGL